MLYGVLKQCSPMELAEGDEEAQAKLAEDQDKAQDKIKRKMMLRNKIASVGRMNKILVSLRKNQEELLELKQMAPDGKLPKNAILQYKPPIE